MQLPPKSTPSLSSRTMILSHLTKSSLSVKFTNPLKKIEPGTISHYTESPLHKMMDSSKMSVSVSTPQSCLAQAILPLAQLQICPHMSTPDDWHWLELEIHKSVHFLLTCCKAKWLDTLLNSLTFSQNWFLQLRKILWSRLRWPCFSGREWFFKIF